MCVLHRKVRSSFWILVCFLGTRSKSGDLKIGSKGSSFMSWLSQDLQERAVSLMLIQNAVDLLFNTVSQVRAVTLIPVR